MLKRLLDITLSIVGLVMASPILLPIMLVVWLQDFQSPFYIAPRTSMADGVFRMVKLRSMIINADKSGINSTSVGDSRITAVGHFIRRLKLDELTQLWNVLKGDMSLVGPRPNVKRETDLYTSVERGLLTVRPGITDFSSIVFSDEGDILAGTQDPDIAYNRLIRPWKSRLGLLYIENQTVWLDIKLIYLTAVAIVSRPAALKGIIRELKKLDAPQELVLVCHREQDLTPYPPPGSEKIVSTRG